MRLNVVFSWKSFKVYTGLHTHVCIFVDIKIIYRGISMLAKVIDCWVCRSQIGILKFETSSTCGAKNETSPISVNVERYESYTYSGNICLFKQFYFKSFRISIFVLLVVPICIWKFEYVQSFLPVLWYTIHIQHYMLCQSYKKLPLMLPLRYCCWRK